MTKLEKLYRQYNKQYFGNSLPSLCKISWAKLPKDRIGHENSCEFRLSNGQRPAVIRLDNSIKRFAGVVHMTLLHEMVHLYLDLLGYVKVVHGKLFQEEMLRIAKAGAFKKWW